MKVLGIFDHAYLINLDRDVERLEKAQRRLRAAGIPFTRFPALQFEGPVRERPDHRRGAFGSALSHRAVLRAAHAQGLESVLIFEDDVLLASDVQE